MTRHSTRGILLPLLAAASLLVGACSEAASPETAAPDKSSRAAPPSSSEAADTSARAWKPLSSEPELVPLEAGAYGLTANGGSEHVAVIRAPAGYQQLEGWTLVTDVPFRALGLLNAGLVTRDPCGSGARSEYDPGPSVEDLAEALVAHEGAVTSEPRPVTVGGHEGLFLTYRIAEGVDVATCADGVFQVFTSPAEWYLEFPGERAAIWILDVDGERLVLAWVAVTDVHRAQTRELTGMVESARFVEP